MRRHFVFNGAINRTGILFDLLESQNITVTNVYSINVNGDRYSAFVQLEKPIDLDGLESLVKRLINDIFIY